jgi:hypothetical protein
MESDPDAVPLRDELFTQLPEIQEGHMTIPTAPGWGTDLNEKTAGSTPGVVSAPRTRRALTLPARHGQSGRPRRSSGQPTREISR